MMQEWFKEAKLGIFMHWGIYAVNGITESWSFYNGEISYEDYMKQLEGFTASKYNPDEWAELFKEAGAKYVVLTTKHHDGVALWDTKLSDLNVVEKTPAARDLIGPYCEALRKQDLKVGLYFSHLDWSHPDYPSLICAHDHENRNKFSTPPDLIEDPIAWERFLKFHRGQLKELMTEFAPVDLLWFDGNWDRTTEQWDMKELKDYLHSFNSEVILNSRMGGYGDFETPEQALPIITPNGTWEFCMTVNDSWGYQEKDKNYKSTRQIIQIFAECIGKGGNLLLDIGPQEDGSIDPEQSKRLLELGQWIKKHVEAIYTTDAGLPLGHFNGPTTLSKDKKTLYLFMFDRPWESIAVKGIKNNIKSISVVGGGTQLTYKKIGGAPWCNIPGILWIDTPDEIFDSFTTVIKIELEGAIDLYREAGQEIQVN